MVKYFLDIFIKFRKFRVSIVKLLSGPVYSNVPFCICYVSRKFCPFIDSQYIMQTRPKHTVAIAFRNIYIYIIILSISFLIFFPISFFFLLYLFLFANKKWYNARYAVYVAILTHIA